MSGVTILATTPSGMYAAPQREAEAAAHDRSTVTIPGRSHPAFGPPFRCAFPLTPGLYLTTRPPVTACPAPLSPGPHTRHRRTGPSLAPKGQGPLPDPPSAAAWIVTWFGRNTRS